MQIPAGREGARTKGRLRGRHLSALMAAGRQVGSGVKASEFRRPLLNFSQKPFGTRCNFYSSPLTWRVASSSESWQPRLATAPPPPPLPKRRRGKAGAKRRPPEATPGSVLDLVACAPRARHDCLDSGACLARYDRHPRRRLCVMQHSVKQCSATDLIPEHNCSYTLSNCHVKQFTFFIFSYHESSSLYLISSPFLVIYKDLPLFFVLVKYL